MAILGFWGWETGSLSEGAAIGGGSLSSVNPITGIFSAKCTPVTSGVGIVTPQRYIFGTTGAGTGDWTAATSYISFRMRIDTLPTATEYILRVMTTGGGANKLWLKLNPTGHIIVSPSSGADSSPSIAALSVGTVYRIDVKVPTGASVTSEVRINGTVDTGCDLTGNFHTSNGGRIGSFGKAADIGGSGYNIYFDDLVVSNSSYAPDDYQIANIYPNALGSTSEWSSSAGGPATVANVDDVPMDVTDYAVSSAAGQTQLYGFQSCATAGISGTIHGVSVLLRALENSEGANLAAVRVRSGATDFDLTPLDIGGDQVLGRVMLLDPATGIAWATAGIDALEAGIIEDASSAVRTRMAGIMGVVLFSGSASAVPVIIHYATQAGA